MSSLSNFFGGGGSDQKSSSFLPAQATWMKNLLATYGPQVGQGQESYPGTRVAPLTSTQQGLLGSLGSWSQFLTPNTGSPLYAQTGAALSDVLAGEMGAEPYTDEAVDELFEAAYATPTWKHWSENVRPEIEESFSGPGYWSTARMNAVGQGAQDTADTLNSQYGALRYATDQANRQLAEAKAGRALAAIPLAGDYVSQPLRLALAGIAGTGQLYDIASAEQRQQQAEIAANLEKWMESQQITDPQVLGVMLDLLGMRYETSKRTERGPGLGHNMATTFFDSIGQGFDQGLGTALAGI